MIEKKTIKIQFFFAHMNNEKFRRKKKKKLINITIQLEVNSKVDNVNAKYV